MESFETIKFIFKTLWRPLELSRVLSGATLWSLLKLLKNIFEVGTIKGFKWRYLVASDNTYQGIQVVPPGGM